MARLHPWSSGVENEVDIMPIDRDQYNTRGTTVDKHFMRRRLVEKRKEEWKKMLKSDKEDVPTSINYRANAKNNVKREVVVATAQRLSDNSHAAIREMRSARLSAVHTAPPKEAKSQSAREMRLARLKQNSSATSPPTIQKHKSLKKAVRVEQQPPEPKDPYDISETIQEKRLAQGKAPVAKSYTSSTAVLRVPKTASPQQKPAIQSVRPPKQTPIRKANKPRTVQVEQEESESGGGCQFINKDVLSGGCNGFTKNGGDDDGCQFVNTDDLTGGCNAANNIQDVGCDFSLLKDFDSIASFLGCGGNDDSDAAPSAELVSRGSSEDDSAAMYVKKYGYDF